MVIIQCNLPSIQQNNTGWAVEVNELTEKMSEMEQERKLNQQHCEDQSNELKVHSHVVTV